MKRFLTIIAILLPAWLHAQLQAGFSAGIGFYNMQHLKQFQSQSRAAFPLRPQTTDAFPPYFTYRIGIAKTNQNGFTFGGNLTFLSTGGRVSYKDYSGEMRTDILLKGYAFAHTLGHAIHLRDQQWRVLLDLRPGMILTKLDIDFLEQIGNQKSYDHYALTSFNVTLEPTATVQRTIGRFAVHAAFGYHLSLLSGKLNFNNSDGAYLTDYEDKPIHAEWHGLRTAIGVEYVIVRRRSQQ